MWTLHVLQNPGHGHNDPWLLSGAGDRCIKLWRLADGPGRRSSLVCFDSLLGHRDGVYALTSWPDGRFARSAATKRSVLMKASGLESAPFFYFFSPHLSVLVRSNLRFAAANPTFFPLSSPKSGSADNTVRLWTILPRHTSEQLKGHTAAVVALAVLDEHRLAR